MCGIAGIVSFVDAPVDRGRLKAMCDSIRHRGPDGEGYWIDGLAGFGHRRLAIVDVAGGAQPMTTADERLCVTYNGEIYNHPSLKKELEGAGCVYRTRCDTETILHLYGIDGDRLVDRLHGMFAFALWDRSRQRLLLARDRLGIKPLYYVVTERELVFASEIKALIAAGAVTPQLDPSVIPEYLATRFVTGDKTFFQGVRRLMPGHTLTWSRAEGVQIRRYWKVPSGAAAEPRLSMDEAARELRDRLSAAVQRHLMSDVPLGVFLSGGIDSSALAALTATMIKERLRTFAVGFAEREANELPYARLVAKSIGADHHEVVVSPRQFFEALPRLIWQEDEPIAFSSSVPLHFVSALARDHVKVVLTGEGADELFLGYNRYRVTAWNERLGRRYRHVAPAFLRKAIQQALSGSPRPIRRRAERTFLVRGADLRAIYFENFSVFPDARRQAILPGVFTDPYAPSVSLFENASGDTLARLSQLDLQTYLHELLMKQDQMSMSASIESRVPFLDDDLIDYVSSLPSALKVSGWTGKAVLRRAVRDLVPPEIISRRKMGFPVPVGRWLREDFRPVVDEFVLGGRVRARRQFLTDGLKSLVDEHRAGRDHSERLWLLINLEIWQRIACDGEAPADVMHEALQHKFFLQGSHAPRLQDSYANPLDQDGRAVAAHLRRPAAQLPHPVGTRQGS